MSVLHSSPHFLEQALLAVESELQHLSAALLGADPAVLQLRSEQMRQVTIDFIRALDGVRGNVLSEEMQRRIRKIHVALSMQRDSLARLAAVTDRQMAVLLPPVEASPTYSSVRGTSARLAPAARIYKAAG